MDSALLRTHTRTPRIDALPTGRPRCAFTMTTFGSILRVHPGPMTAEQVQQACLEEAREIKTAEEYEQLRAEDPAALLFALITQTKIETVRLQANPAAEEVCKTRMILPAWYHKYAPEAQRNLLLAAIVKIFVHSGYELFRDEAAVRDAVMLSYACE